MRVSCSRFIISWALPAHCQSKSHNRLGSAMITQKVPCWTIFPLSGFGVEYRRTSNAFCGASQSQNLFLVGCFASSSPVWCCRWQASRGCSWPTKGQTTKWRPTSPTTEAETGGCCRPPAKTWGPTASTVCWWVFQNLFFKLLSALWNWEPAEVKGPSSGRQCSEAAALERSFFLIQPNRLTSHLRNTERKGLSSSAPLFLVEFWEVQKKTKTFSGFKSPRRWGGHAPYVKTYATPAFHRCCYVQKSSSFEVTTQPHSTGEKALMVRASSSRGEQQAQWFERHFHLQIALWKFACCF